MAANAKRKTEPVPEKVVLEVHEVLWEWGQLRELRERRGLSQTDLAVKIAGQAAVISRWEKGRSGMRIANAMRIADALDVELVLVVAAQPSLTVVKQ